MNTTATHSLWTVWLDYFATGEGRSMMAVIDYASSEEQAKELFAKKFGDWFKIGCDAAPGVVQNPVTQYLFSAQALQIITQNDGKGNVVAHASVHINLS